MNTSKSWEVESSTHDYDVLVYLCMLQAPKKVFLIWKCSHWMEPFHTETMIYNHVK